MVEVLKNIGIFLTFYAVLGLLDAAIFEPKNSVKKFYMAGSEGEKDKYVLKDNIRDLTLLDIFHIVITAGFIVMFDLICGIFDDEAAVSFRRLINPILNWKPFGKRVK